MNSKLLTIVIPCYNEGENIPQHMSGLLDFCQQEGYDIVFVNDGSSDNTAELLTKYKHDCLKVINHKVNKGYGGAIITGIRHAETKYVITIDADGQHRLEDVKKLLTQIVESNADMIVGSREGQRSASITRGLGKWIIRKVAKFLMPMDIYDLNSGMKIYNRELALKYLHLCPNTMAYSDVIALLFINNRHLVIEEPIEVLERTGGKSTIGVKTAIDTVMEIVNIVMLFHPFRIFVPISFICLALGLIWAVRCYVINMELPILSSVLIISSVIVFLMGLVSEQLAEIRRNMHNNN